MAAIGPDLRRAILHRSVFAGVTSAELDTILSRGTLRRVDRGGTILRRGDPSAGMFVVVQGRVRIGLTSDEGKEVTIGMLGPGETLGEMSLLDGEDCSADAYAHEECLLLAIERGSFLRLLRGDADLCMRLLASLAGRLRRANAALEEMALLDLPSRLGRLLTRLARDFGQVRPTGRRIELKLSQRELAALVGSSREKVNRLLCQWEQDGTVAKEDGRLVVLRPDALDRFD